MRLPADTSGRRLIERKMRVSWENICDRRFRIVSAWGSVSGGTYGASWKPAGWVVGDIPYRAQHFKIGIFEWGILRRNMEAVSTKEVCLGAEKIPVWINVQPTSTIVTFLGLGPG